MRKFLFACLVLAGCTIPPLSPTLLSDANLAIAALQALNTDATLLGAPLADTTAITIATGAIQTALTDMQNGIKTPQDFATAVDDEVSQLAPTLLKDFKANTTVTTGVVLLQQLVLLIGAEVTAPTTSAQAAVRQKMQNWVVK